jgi:hypothetical protein
LECGVHRFGDGDDGVVHRSLWLMGSSEPAKKAVTGYFRDPAGHGSQAGTGQSGASENIGIGKDAPAEQQIGSRHEAGPEPAKLKRCK